MRMPTTDDRSSRRVGFAPEPFYSRCPAEDEAFVMKHFHRHAQGCTECHDPYSTYLRGGTLCDKGHKLAKDVFDYVYSKGGTPYSVIDRKYHKQDVKVEIPSNCRSVVGLLQALEQGLRVRKSRPAASHDRSYYVPTRPDKPRYDHDNHRGSPVKEPRRHHREDDRRYAEDRNYRKHRHSTDYLHDDRARYADKRYSLPSKYTSHRGYREDAIPDRKHRHSWYDGNPVYYYKPSKYGSERRIPRSESPKREARRAYYPEGYQSSRYVPPDRHSSRYEYPGNYRSSRYTSPDSYHSSRHGSPDSYLPSRRSSPESYSSKRRSWSPEQFYRGLFR